MVGRPAWDRYVRPPVGGAHFSTGITYQNRTWFVKREMQEKEPKLGSARERGALLGTGAANGHGNEVAFGEALIIGTVGEVSGQHAPVLAALVKVHVHDLEGHV